METNIIGNQYQIECWNRKYIFEQEAFPASVEIGGEEILAAPISLNAYFSGKKGEWKKSRKVLFEKNQEQAVFTSAMETENIIINAAVKAEEDGFVRIDLTVMPYWCFDADNKPRLTGLSIDIPVKKQFATLMHFWPNCESGVCLSQTVLNSGAVPEGGAKLPFKPYVWLGWEYGGLGICCENPKGFLVKDPDAVYVVEEKDGCINLHITLLDEMPVSWRDTEDKWGHNVPALRYSFGLQATPVKEFPKNNLTDFKAFHLYDIFKSPIYAPVQGKGDTMLETIAQSGANWLILHDEWSLVQNYGSPADEEDFKRFVRDCHGLGLKLMVYFGYEISSLMPDFHSLHDKALNKNRKGHTVGGWQREPMQRDYTVCYNSCFSDIMIERVKYAMDELGVDGIYTDGTYVPWECANEAHGCGYRDDDGILHESYPIFAVREHVKKLYKAVHERGGIIDTHQSSCCLMATLSFVDSYFDGENIQPMVQEDISNLRMDAFRAEYTGLNMGISCNFISYTIGDYTMRKIASVALLHNVYPRANKMEALPFISTIWKIYDDYGIQDAQWCPYWENTRFVAEYPNVYISYYEREGDYLLVIASFDKELKKIALETDCNRIVDLLDADPDCMVVKGCCEIPISYGEVKICRLQNVMEG